MAFVVTTLLALFAAEPAVVAMQRPSPRLGHTPHDADLIAQPQLATHQPCSIANQHVKRFRGGSLDGRWWQLRSENALKLFREDTLSTAILWLVSAVCYLGTLAICDANGTNQPGNYPVLDDVGFKVLPHLDVLAYVTDGIGSALALWTAWTLVWGSKIQRDAARYTVFCVAVGNFFSTSLHSVTRLPPVAYHGATGLPLMGGEHDKLMSNHVFNTGAAFLMLSRLGYLNIWVALVSTTVYSLMMISTHAHYTVDVVLAWWALIVAESFA